MNIDINLIHICRVLNKYSVKYLIVGGAAVAFHGYARLSTSISGKPIEKPDYDFWYKPVYANYFGILKSLNELGVDTSRLMNQTAIDVKKAFLRIPHPDYTIDFLPVLINLSEFNNCHSKCDKIDFEGVDLYFIGLNDLLKEKRREVP